MFYKKLKIENYNLFIKINEYEKFKKNMDDLFFLSKLMGYKIDTYYAKDFNELLSIDIYNKNNKFSIMILSSPTSIPFLKNKKIISMIDSLIIHQNLQININLIKFNNFFEVPQKIIDFL